MKLKGGYNGHIHIPVVHLRKENAEPHGSDLVENHAVVYPCVTVFIFNSDH